MLLLDRPLGAAAAVLATVLLCACGGNRVIVSYPRPGNPSQAERIKALGNAYLLIGKPPRLKNVPGFRGRMFEVDAGAFADALNASLGRLGGHVLAYRVVETIADEPYLDRLAPTGVLIVRFDALAVDAKREEKEVKVKDKAGKESSRKSVSWKYTARLSIRARLLAHPGGAFLHEAPLTVSMSKDLTGTAIPSKEEWTARAAKSLAVRAAKKIPSLFGTVPTVRRTRTLFVDKKDPVSKQAAKLARAGLWEKASELWVERLGSAGGGWRDEMNLALAAEKRRVFPEAERIYARARASAGQDPDAAKIKWEEILADLRQAVGTVGGRSEAALAWFGAPLAVLPFSDETTSIQGPQMLREMIHKTLRRGGYNALELEEVDRALRRRGYSQGGQLKRVKPAEISGWLNGAKLLFGDITEFRNIMLGVYGKRVVAGELRIWDPGKKDFTWTAGEPAVREDFVKDPKEASAAFGGQLMRGMLDLWIRKPLGAESALFVRQNLETYPLRPRE